MDMNHKKTFIDTSENETCHELWSTPIITARPFGDNFIKQLKEDIKPLLEVGAEGTFNKTDLWRLPNLPETMLEVKSKMEELAEKYYRGSSEMPLPPFRVSKGYFRSVVPESPYKITPHKHANSLAVGIFYIEVDESNPGNLVMIDPRGGVNWTNQFSTFKKLRVEEGMMFIHPGYLIHFVEPSDSSKGMYYGNRNAIVSNITRYYDEFLKVLAEEENDKLLRNMGSNDL
jgi:hypothetical protein